jgi:hypothetical protein
VVVDVLKKKNVSARRLIYFIIYMNKDSSCLIGPRAPTLLIFIYGSQTVRKSNM